MRRNSLDEVCNAELSFVDVHVVVRRIDRVSDWLEDPSLHNVPCSEVREDELSHVAPRRIVFGSSKLLEFIEFDVFDVASPSIRWGTWGRWDGLRSGSGFLGGHNVG